MEITVALNKSEEDTNGKVPWKVVMLLRNLNSKRQWRQALSHPLTSDVGHVALKCCPPPPSPDTHSCLLGLLPPKLSM